jgi:hypothetical protein
VPSATLDENVAYSLALAGRAAQMEVIFVFSCLDENVAYSLVLAGLAAHMEVIFAFCCPGEMLLTVFSGIS